MILESNSATQTAQFACSLAQKAKPGMVICLDGELGTGKTVFTQGFAQGLGITEPVSSPTFTIVQVYEGGRLPLYHFDVYRINEPEEM
ncbi:MAG: tRNA (adenosine(37)-N6)-threonylcarbamoyltransferase complex ATPase subunit type 1 TsaE, partial [Lachnospiraceae bacterium]|nr:tRNA (adenosine(37)-N6)-threonylcarbamoyltransferase complex ATPase subunit type 1 TsaE [Lachnospiraceae bacterium]